MDDSMQVVLENCSTSCERWGKSFVGNLEERGEWDFSEYWRLERALYCLVGLAPDRALHTVIFRVFARLSRLISAHLDVDDVFFVKEMSRAEILAMQERFELVFEGVYSGRMPESRLLSPQNPLLSD